MNLKFLPTIIVKYLLRSIYFIVVLLFPINKKKVTFASYRSSKLEGNLKYVYQEMASQYPDYQYHFFIKKFKGSIWGRIEYIFHMLKSIYAIATSKSILLLMIIIFPYMLLNQGVGLRLFNYGML